MTPIFLDIEQLAEYLSTDPHTCLRWLEEGKIPAPWTFDPPADDDDCTVAMHRWVVPVIDAWVAEKCPTRKPLSEERFLRIRRDIAAGILAKRMHRNDKTKFRRNQEAGDGQG